MKFIENFLVEFLEEFFLKFLQEFPQESLQEFHHEFHQEFQPCYAFTKIPPEPFGLGIFDPQCNNPNCIPPLKVVCHHYKCFTESAALAVAFNRKWDETRLPK